MGVSKGSETSGTPGTCQMNCEWYKGGPGLNMLGKCQNKACASQTGPTAGWTNNIQQAFGHGEFNLSLMCGEWKCPACYELIIASKEHPVRIVANKSKWNFRAIDSNTGVPQRERNGECQGFEDVYSVECAFADDAPDGRAEINEIELWPLPGAQHVDPKPAGKEGKSFPAEEKAGGQKEGKIPRCMPCSIM